MTGSLRLLLAVWLLVSAFRALSDPQRTSDAQGIPVASLLPIAALSFTLGAFLLTGFMSRVCGLGVAVLMAWQMATYGPSLIPAVLAMVGLYLMLRGGGAWAMDIYVQRMQERARQST